MLTNTFMRSWVLFFLHINAFYLLDLTYIFIPKEAQKDVSFINDVKYTVHYDFKAGMTYLLLCLGLVALCFFC